MSNRPGRKQGVIRFGIALALVALVLQPRPLVASEAEEYLLKAEFLHRFTEFIDWPSGSFASVDSPFVVCTAGDSPIEGILKKWEANRRIKDHRITVRHIVAGGPVHDCHILFIGAEDPKRLRQILGSTSGRPVLTVADHDGYGALGVLINLYLEEDGHVRFEINAGECRKSGLKISSHLYKLARLVPGSQ